MKKFTVLFLSMLLIFGAVACGKSNTDNNSANGNNSEATSSLTASPTITAAPQETPSSENGSNSGSTAESTGKKVLVVYYSATGSTERVAKSIADAVNADLYEIVPQNVYTSDDLNWNNNNSRVSREHNDESLRDVPLKTTSVQNWADYDTVFIGYPIWWGIAAWPVDNFVKANDFTGKTVIPFCTSASSGLGQSGKLLADMAKGGDWKEGQRFSSGASDSTVKTWVNGLNLSK